MKNNARKGGRKLRFCKNCNAYVRRTPDKKCPNQKAGENHILVPKYEGYIEPKDTIIQSLERKITNS